MHFIYILRCADGSLYTGYARDVDARTKVHNAGKGAKYTCSRRPVELVYHEAFPDLSAALKREHELKRWTKALKELLISAENRRSTRDQENLTKTSPDLVNSV